MPQSLRSSLRHPDGTNRRPGSSSFGDPPFTPALEGMVSQIPSVLDNPVVGRGYWAPGAVELQYVGDGPGLASSCIRYLGPNDVQTLLLEALKRGPDPESPCFLGNRDTSKRDLQKGPVSIILVVPSWTPQVLFVTLLVVGALPSLPGV